MFSGMRGKLRTPSSLCQSNGSGPTTTPSKADSSHDGASNPSPEVFPPTAFTYVPLQDWTSDFRLMILDPATHPSSDICGEVFNSSLHSAPNYEALSYVWGERSAVVLKRITLRHTSSSKLSPSQAKADSFEFYITPNLEAALRALRLPDKRRTLWVDFICIDQNNLIERSKQVLLMGWIYRQSIRDLLWLGSETAKIRRAMNLVERLIPGTDRIPKLSELLEDDWSDIEAMFGANQVWSRIWIVQELYFAPTILLFCDGQSLDWEAVVKMIEDNQEFQDIWINQNGSKVFQDAHRCFGHITVFQVIRHEMSVPKGLFDRNIMSMVITFGDWQATERIDKIYALLNLAEDAKDFPVDCTKSVDEVSIDFADHVITRNKSLSILSAALGDPLRYLARTEGKSPRNLPSWVMDISKPIPSTSGLSMLGQTKYNACGMIAEAICRLSIDRRHLVASGWTVDTVGLLNTVSPVADTESPRDRWIRDVRRWAPKDGEKHEYIPTNETLLNAYWRTITTDRKQDRRITTADIEGPTWYEWYESLEERTVPDEQVALPGWRFGTSKGGIYCMLPPTAQEDDMIVVLFGAKIPYLLRPMKLGGDEHKLVGEVYMHGFMDGQIMIRVAKQVQEGKVCVPEAFTIL